MRLLSAVLLFVLAPHLLAQESSRKATTPDEQSARVLTILSETVIELKDQKRNTSLEQFLAALEAVMPEGKKLSLSFDRDAFGKDENRVRKAQLQTAPRLNQSVASILRWAMERAKVDGVELDYAIRPPGVVITRARLAGLAATYEVRDILDQMPLLLPMLRQDEQNDFRDVPVDDAPGNLIRHLSNSVDLRAWDSVQLLNATRLKVTATPSRHLEIRRLLSHCRSLASVGVYMNARLYEVDRTFYTKEVAPLFAKGKEEKERPPALPIDGNLLLKVMKKKLLLDSEEVKLVPGQTRCFLGQQTVFRYDAGPRAGGEEGRQIGTGLFGVTFEVRPLISPDRRELRLHITQNAVQLVGIKRAKKLDPASGKETMVESPTLRRSSLTGTVQIEDGNPFLMRVDYRPPGKEGEDKVWLLIALPMIWIEEEVEFLRRNGGVVSPRSVWDIEPARPAKPAVPPPPPPVPLNADVKDILQAILTDLLTNKELKSMREFYGTVADRNITLVHGETLSWPKEFQAATHGYKVVTPDPFDHPRRVLGIRLDKFGLQQPPEGLFNSPIEVCLYNAGGSANGGTIGGCSVYYVAKKVGKRWTVECQGFSDP